MQTCKVKIAIKQLSKGISISIYLLCFIILLLFPTATSLAYMEHEHEYEATCRATGMPECNCTSDSSQLPSSIADYSGVNKFNDLYCHTEIADDCGICVLVHKTITQKRYYCLKSYSLINPDISPDSQEIVGVGFTCTIVPTPVSLKTRQCN